MRELFMILILFIVVFGIVYILYINGIGEFASKAALMYQCYPRIGKNRNRIKAKFASCRGMTKRVIYLQPRKRYCFAFSSSLTKGSVRVEIQDQNRENLLVLDQQHPLATIWVEGRGRMYVTTRYSKAGGEYELSWDVQE